MSGRRSAESFQHSARVSFKSIVPRTEFLMLGRKAGVSLALSRAITSGRWRLVRNCPVVHCRGGFRLGAHGVHTPSPVGEKDFLGMCSMHPNYFAMLPNDDFSPQMFVKSIKFAQGHPWSTVTSCKSIMPALQLYNLGLPQHMFGKLTRKDFLRSMNKFVPQPP